ncbi:hypothetical protein BB559_003413 [Furculomyces boomerangus]|uniref:Uncharacterized protein n=1 Tax=Furculomyces boomerangus TaxID=61424 RepID=A0A2T9YLC9_9FUNG|nr:hypothetical protein BB559_003413 [Furculomyces boomerangus]
MKEITIILIFLALLFSVFGSTTIMPDQVHYTGYVHFLNIKNGVDVVVYRNEVMLINNRYIFEKIATKLSKNSFYTVRGDELDIRFNTMGYFIEDSITRSTFISWDPNKSQCKKSFEKYFCVFEGNIDAKRYLYSYETFKGYPLIKNPVKDQFGKSKSYY